MWLQGNQVRHRQIRTGTVHVRQQPQANIYGKEWDGI